MASSILFNADEVNSPEKAEANRLLAKTMKLCVDTKEYVRGAYTMFNIMDTNFPENSDIVRDGIAMYRKLQPDGSNPEFEKYLDIIVKGVEAFYDKDYKESENFCIGRGIVACSDAMESERTDAYIFHLPSRL